MSRQYNDPFRFPNRAGMTPAETLVLGAYFFVLIILAAFGWHRYYLVYVYMKHKDKVPVAQGQFAELPVVTVQLPLYNEMYVVDRLIDAVARIDYPRDRLEIQVLDDSTDETRDRRAGRPRHAAQGSTSSTCTGPTARATRPARSRPA
jgi:hypothetical protein